MQAGGGQYQRIPGGSVDLQTLEKIAETTGGKSFYASNEEALKRVLSDIQGMEKTKIQGGVQVVYDELYHRFLLLGVFFFVLAELFRRFLRREAL